MFEILRQVSTIYKCLLPKFHTLVFDFSVNQPLKIDIHAPLVSSFWACVRQFYVGRNLQWRRSE